MQQFKRSFWQLLFFLTLALSLITFAFIKRPKFQSSLVVTTTYTKVWGYAAPYAIHNLNAFKNDEATKAVFGILNKLFSDKKTAVSLFIHHFLLNKANLAKSRFRKTSTHIQRDNTRITQGFTISNRARTWGLWSREGERALMDPDFKLSSLGSAQQSENWLIWLRNLVMITSVFNSDYARNVQGAFNLEKTTTNIRDLFVGWTVEEMKVQLKGAQGNDGAKGTQGIQGDKGEQGLKGADGKDGVKGKQGKEGLGTQGLPGTQGDQGLRGPAGQNGQVEKEAVIGLSIALGVVFCLFLVYVMAIHQKRIFSAFKSRKKSTKI